MGIINSNQDQFFMRAALEQAEIAAQNKEVPVGAVVVHNGEIITETHNQVITLNDPTAHAEVLALRLAGKKIGNYRLVECDLYVTLEPCTMCAGACVHARLNRLVYGASDLKTGVVNSVDKALSKAYHNHQVDIVSGVLADQCGQIVSDFFARRRAEKKADMKSAKSNTEK